MTLTLLIGMNVKNQNRTPEQIQAHMEYIAKNFPKHVRMYELLNNHFGLLTGDAYSCNVSVGPGWVSILKEVLEEFAEIQKRDESLRIVQVKEKFGGLRIYTISSEEVYDEVHVVIRNAEQKASKTCEDCGSIENVEERTSGWIRTLCENCESGRRNPKT